MAIISWMDGIKNYKWVLYWMIYDGLLCLLCRLNKMLKSQHKLSEINARDISVNSLLFTYLATIF